MTTYEDLRDLISNHRLMLEIKHPSIPDKVKCGCGVLFAVPEEHINHLAEIIIKYLEGTADASRQA